MDVRLTWGEIRRAAAEGCDRRIAGYARRGGSSPNYGPSTPWDRDIVGAIGELAVAVAAGIPWTPSTYEERHLGDVNGWEVRTTQHRLHRMGINRDAPARVFVLVTVIPELLPVAYVRGWIHADDARQEKWWDHYLQRPCFMVPPSALNPWPPMTVREGITR